ncbi:MAG: SMC-Scp complex subunit ScpB [Eubacteriales bacterium]
MSEKIKEAENTDVSKNISEGESELPPLSLDDAKKVLEAVLFASGHPVTFAKLSEIMNMTEEAVRDIVAEYKKEYDSSFPRGIQLLILGNACQICTKEEYAPYVRRALGVREGGNLSRSSLEALAVIAYNQPVTKTYVDQVRGADSAYAVSGLLERGLIECLGRLDVPGRPRLYGTTAAFLRAFGLSSIEELPPLELSAGENL